MIQRYLGLGFNWAIILTVIGLLFTHQDYWLNLISQHPAETISLVSALLTSLGFALNRRVKTDKTSPQFFSEPDLLNIPENKIRYSDRIAYIMAELSELAYFEVEKEHDNFVQFIEKAKSTIAAEEETLDEVIKLYRTQIRSHHNTGCFISSEADLANLLQQHNFQLHPPYLNVGSAQGFICEYMDNADPFIAVVFRGSEKKIEDWLTNANAIPSTRVKHGKVHSGFYDDFTGLQQQIATTISAIKARRNNQAIPVFFTGHSLGGAVATVATRELMPDGIGACYTFGAPRVGDYEYFQFVKTPIYRVVNSSDLVPRLPPGAWTCFILKLIRLLRLITIRFPSLAACLNKAESFINQLKDYRHFGDLRYLTDVDSKRFNEVMLLRNPNNLDVIQWFWRHIIVSLGMPVKSHGMGLYRKKLKEVGLQRMKQKPVRNAALGYFHGE